MLKLVPMVLQMENAECGAASLAMIMRYYGNYSLALEQLRLDCHVSRDGVTIRGIKDAAEKHGLKCKVVKADPRNIKTLTMPAIIHWNMNHFVVLTGFSKHSYFINDPAIGKIKVSYEEFNKSFTGIAMELTKTKQFKIKLKKNSYSFTRLKTINFRGSLLLISFFGAIITIMSMVIPYFSSTYIDNIIIEPKISSFKPFLFSLFSVILLKFFAEVIKEKASYETERNMNISLSVGFMEKILKLPIIYFLQRTPGELANRQLGSFETAQLICKNVTPIFFHSILIIIYCIIAFKFNMYFAFIGIAAIIANLIITIISSNKMGDISALNKKNTGLYYGSVASSIKMIDTIKSCACEEAIFERLTGSAAGSLQTVMQKEKINTYASAFFEFVNFSVSASILVTGITFVLNGELTIGVTVGLMGAFSAFMVPIGEFINSVSAMYDLRSISERTDDTMRYNDDDTFLPGDTEQTKTMGNGIAVENVSYTYGGSAKSAVKNVSFSVENGKSVALTGESGGGKSTVIKMIAGLYTETEGHIYYGKAEKKDLHKDEFYSKIAVVSQSVKLYEGTILDNISMWNRAIEYEDVVKACKAACIHDEIISRKNAYFDNINEGGENFSGGQRQRFEIARALVRRPEILILDEATSALDANTEIQIMKNLSSLGITLIIVAHRLNTIRNCDEILVFSNGEIAERGNHQTLLNKNGLYAQLVKEE